MAHKKPTSKKSPASKNSPAKRKAVSVVSKSSASAVPASPVKVGSSVYSEMAQRSLVLWREQLSAMSRSPQAMQEMGKMMQPVFSLFTQGMDMWLMMADPFNQGAAAYTGSQAASNDAQKTQKSSAKQPSKKSGKAAAKSSQRAAPVAAPDVAGVSAMAELARRIANMERQRANASAAQSKPAGTKTAAVIGFEEAAGQRRRSGSRA